MSQLKGALETLPRPSAITQCISSKPCTPVINTWAHLSIGTALLSLIIAYICTHVFPRRSQGKGPPTPLPTTGAAFQTVAEFCQAKPHPSPKNQGATWNGNLCAHHPFPNTLLPSSPWHGLPLLLPSYLPLQTLVPWLVNILFLQPFLWPFPPTLCFVIFQPWLHIKISWVDFWKRYCCPDRQA